MADNWHSIEMTNFQILLHSDATEVDNDNV